MAAVKMQNQLTRSLERILEDAQLSGELKLSGRKLKEFPSTIFHLTDTVIADLSKNRLTELPNELTTFPYLERVHLYHNAIRSIPESVVTLRSLTYLDLSRNQLTFLPKEICELPIQVLLVSSNRLTSLPDELGRMTELCELDASNNQITHLPHHLGDMHNLRSLILRNNLLLCLSIEVTYLDLVKLDVRSNRIAQLPVELRLMRGLVDLQLADNPLTLPPAALCKRGRVHIFKFLEHEAAQRSRLKGGSGAGSASTEIRRSSSSGASAAARRSNSLTPSVQPRMGSHLHKRHNVDSGYSTSDGFDKRWSQEVQGGSDESLGRKTWHKHHTSPLTVNTDPSGISTPSTISPGGVDDDLDRVNKSNDNLERLRYGHHSSGDLNGYGSDDKNRQALHHIQTYREYKEALKQQRTQDIYRSRDSTNEGSLSQNKTEPCTPTHVRYQSKPSGLATSKSDPTPLHAVLSTKQIFDDTKIERERVKPVQKVTPCRKTNFSTVSNTNGDGNEINGVSRYDSYVKPTSPIKGSSASLTYDSIPTATKYPSPRMTNKLSTSQLSNLSNASSSNTLMSTSNNSMTNSTISNASSHVNGATSSYTTTNGSPKCQRSVSWTNREVAPDQLSFTMRREFDKAREESDLIQRLRSILETKLKMELPDDLASALTDGVVLCHLANHVRPRSVASIHVPSPAVPKLTMARCRRNVDNFLEACRRIGVDENLICCAADVLEGRGLVQVAVTVTELLRKQPTSSPRNFQYYDSSSGNSATSSPLPTLI